MNRRVVYLVSIVTLMAAGCSDSSAEPTSTTTTLPATTTVDTTTTTTTTAEPAPFRDGFSISVATRGDPVPADVELWLEQIRWDVDGDGEWDIVDICAPRAATEAPAVFDCGGSVDEPIGEFVFDYRGLYAPTVELQWDGYYEAYFNGAVDGVFVVRGEFDTADLVTSHTLVDFPVIEIRSALDG